MPTPTIQGDIAGAYVPLDDRAIVHRGILERHEPREFAATDHEAARVLRRMTWIAEHLRCEHDRLMQHG